MHLVRAGVVYFGLTYLAGFCLGVLRETFIVPQLGQFAATLIELPAILTAAYIAARYVVGLIVPPLTSVDRIIIGATGFALLLAAEIILAGILRGWTFAHWLGHLATPEGALSLAMFAVFAVMPLLVRRA